MELWLVCSFPDKAVRVHVLAGGIGLCSWARHLNLTVPLSSRVYKSGTGELNTMSDPVMDREHPLLFML